MRVLRRIHWPLTVTGLLLGAFLLFLSHMENVRYQNAERMAAQAYLHSLEMKIESFWIDTHRWPRTLTALVSDDGTPGWKGPYAEDRNLKFFHDVAPQYVPRADAPPLLSISTQRGVKLQEEMDTPRLPPGPQH